MSRRHAANRVRRDHFLSRTIPSLKRSDISDAPLVRIASTKRLPLFLSGLVFALMFHGIYLAAQRWLPDDDSIEARNSLLLSQQLDQLFRKIDHVVTEEPSRLPAFLELLQVFYVYDRRFVDQNQGHRNTAIETANAAIRLGICAKVFGDPELSKSHYHEARQTLKLAIEVDPLPFSLVHSLLEVQTAIFGLHQDMGETEAAVKEFESACQLVRSASTDSFPEAIEVLAPHYQSLAAIAIKMQRHADAFDLLERYRQSIQTLLIQDPGQTQWEAELRETIELLNRLSVHRSESGT